MTDMSSSIRPADASFIRSINEGISGASLRSLTRVSEFGLPARELAEVPQLILVGLPYDNMERISCAN